MSQTQRVERDLSATQELRKLSEQSHSDGTVTVELESWERTDGGDRVRVEFWTPTNELASETMDWPQAGETLSDYKFVRLLQSVGLSLDTPSFDHADDLRAERDEDGEWTLVVPEVMADGPLGGLKTRAGHSIKELLKTYRAVADEADDGTGGRLTLLALFTVCWPLFFIACVLDALDGHEGGIMYLSGFLGFLLWAGGILGSLYLSTLMV